MPDCARANLEDCALAFRRFRLVQGDIKVIPTLPYYSSGDQVVLTDTGGKVEVPVFHYIQIPPAELEERRSSVWIDGVAPLTVAEPLADDFGENNRVWVEAGEVLLHPRYVVLFDDEHSR